MATRSKRPPEAHPESAPDRPAIHEHLQRLDQHHAQWQREQAEEIDQLKEVWAPKVATARTILAQLEALEAAYGPTVEDLAGRDFASVPRTPNTLNALAAIERACTELRQLWGPVKTDLQRLIREVEQLRPETLPLFRAHAPIYRQQLAFYVHAPAGIQTTRARLVREVASLTQGLESLDCTPLPPLPEPPDGITVELA